MAAFARSEAGRVLERICRAADENDLFELSSYAFGRESFSAQFVVAHRNASDSRCFFGLQKRVVLAEFWDHLIGRVSWTPKSTTNWGLRGPKLWQIGHHLRSFSADSFPYTRRMKLASESWTGLNNELALFFQTDDDAFTYIKDRLMVRVTGAWLECHRRRDAMSRSEHGQAMGTIVIDLVMTIASLRGVPFLITNLSRVTPTIAALTVINRREFGANGRAPAFETEQATKRRTRTAAVEDNLAPVVPRGDPKSLDECLTRLHDAKDRLEKHGYQPKYTDQQLLALARKGEMTDRFLVTMQRKKAESESLGRKRDSGRAPYWGTSFDQIENADHNFALIAALQGMSEYNPKDEYVLLIIDRGADHLTNGDAVMLPTWEKLIDFGQKEFSGTYDEATIKGVMSEDYAPKFAALIDELKKTPHPKTGQPMQEYLDQHAKIFADHKGMSKDEKKRFLTRHYFRTELGANKDFLGTGVTKWKGGAQKFGTVETLTVPNHPSSISELRSQGKLVTISNHS